MFLHCLMDLKQTIYFELILIYRGLSGRAVKRPLAYCALNSYNQKTDQTGQLGSAVA